MARRIAGPSVLLPLPPQASTPLGSKWSQITRGLSKRNILVGDFRGRGRGFVGRGASVEIGVGGT